MNKFNYKVDISNLKVLTTSVEQSRFFASGHPMFLIPDFSLIKQDIWTSYMDFLEKQYNCEIYDQDGGEITHHSIIDQNTGLTKCEYTAYGLEFLEGDDPKDVEVEVEGYVIEDENGLYFLATNVIEKYEI